MVRYFPTTVTEQPEKKSLSGQVQIKRENTTKSLLMAPHWSIVLFQRYRFTIDEKRRPLRASQCQYTYAHNAALTLTSEHHTPLHNPLSVLWKDLVHLRQHVLCIPSKVGVYLHALETCCIMRKYSPEQYMLLRGRIILSKKASATNYYSLTQHLLGLSWWCLATGR